MKPGKSKLALAKVINENGGWPQDSEWAVQNGDRGRISFSINKPVRHDSKSWMAKGGFSFKIEVCKPLKNWHQCVLNREEYYQAYPMTDDDGWIEWKGGECPVDNDSLVDVKFPDGSEYFNTDAYWDWSSESDTPISHYRQSKKVVKPCICESVTSSIPEPESIDGLCAKVTEENKHQHVDAKPTIEQLAQDYRNKLDFAKRKQQEADAYKADADDMLKELELAGEAIGLLVSPITAKQEPELAITDWRDLQTGDLVWVEEEGGLVAEGEYEVLEVEVPDYDGKRTIRIRGGEGGKFWINYENGWCFIRRP